ATLPSVRELLLFCCAILFCYAPKSMFSYGKTAQFPPCGLSTAPAAAAPRSPYRHLELCGIALYLTPNLDKMPLNNQKQRQAKAAAAAKL
ncbi:MAG: hypothetical protein WAV62_07465, partial [Gemmiger qucibialis]